MLACFPSFRKLALPAILIAAWALSACAPGGTQGSATGPSIDAGERVQVALLVPASSGDSGGVLAQSLENAARLAISDLNGAAIDLRVYDTGGRPDLAANAAAQAVNDGAKIILGPVFAEAANAAGVTVARRDVNVLAFSNNPDIAGGNVYILGTTFQNTADRLVRYANAQGRGNVFIVHGQDTAETIGANAIRQAIAGSGAQLAGTASFPLSQQGVVNAIPGIAGQIRSTGATSVFLTSGTAGALPFLADLLPENGVDPETTQMIGLQRFDIPSSALSLTGLQGGWFALPDPQTAQQFRARYQAAYGGPPHPLGALAYDGIAAIGALVASGRSDALTGRALTQSSGFLGANGAFRLRADGTNERALSVAEVRSNQVVVISTAPRGFGGAGL